MSIELLLGELKGRLDDIKEDIVELKQDVKALQRFKWKVAGGAGVLSIILTTMIELVQYLTKK